MIWIIFCCHIHVHIVKQPVQKRPSKQPAAAVPPEPAIAVDLIIIIEPEVWSGCDDPVNQGWYMYADLVANQNTVTVKSINFNSTSNQCHNACTVQNSSVTVHGDQHSMGLLWIPSCLLLSPKLCICAATYIIIVWIPEDVLVSLHNSYRIA